MLIRFLETCESERPGLPFQAGQIIDVATPTDTMLEWLRSSRAVILRQASDEEEYAVEPAPVETAVTTLTRKERRRLRHAG